jgi:hypothetical protein
MRQDPYPAGCCTGLLYADTEKAGYYTVTGL